MARWPVSTIRSPRPAIGALVARLETEVRSRAGTPDHRLPPERELARRFGVPRRALRGALRVLADNGRITRHVGRGTFVTAAIEGRKPFPELVQTSPVEVMAVRLAVEPSLMPLAAGAARPADRDALDACLARGRSASSHEEFELWDASLHQALAAATHNPLAIAVLEVCNAARGQPYWGNLKRRGFDPARQAVGQREHEQVVQAVKDGDGPMAQARMRMHLTQVSQRLLGTIAATTAGGADG